MEKITAKDVQEKLSEAVVEAKYPFEIDFGSHTNTAGGRADLKKGLKIKKGTKTYKALDKMSAKEAGWTKYLDYQARSGITVEYDNAKDIYVAQLTK